MADEIYSEIILDLYKNPQNFGHLKEYDIKASGGNPICGDEVSFEVKIDQDKINEIKFVGEGCAISKASSSLLTEMAKGKPLWEVKKISNQDVFESLGGVIQTRIKCALLGISVLKMGIEKFEQNGKRKTEVQNLRI
ncbi:MAG: SUF system NifU family Fe-S cluster assembly protein [Candidatus Diapherotrites archaeon]|nr:SUF system NifU family Fe-S cluster assembly protein [Candidatus Diapherotrites archaeon]